VKTTQLYRTRNIILVLGIIVAILIGITSLWYTVPLPNSSVTQPVIQTESTSMIKNVTEFLIEKGQIILKQSKEIL